jgi:hypothetical protein
LEGEFLVLARIDSPVVTNNIRGSCQEFSSKGSPLLTRINRRSFLAFTAMGVLSALIVSGAVLAESGLQPGKTSRVGFSQLVDHPALKATLRSIDCAVVWG